MIQVKCARCGDELVLPGGLLFSPPFTSLSGPMRECYKDHLCERCYYAVREVIGTGNRQTVRLDLDGYEAGNLLALLKRATRYDNGDWYQMINSRLRELVRANNLTLTDNFGDGSVS